MEKNNYVRIKSNDNMVKIKVRIVRGVQKCHPFSQPHTM